MTVHRASFRFAVWVAAALAVTTLVMAWIYDLPVRDPDSAVGPTWLRLPAILLVAFLADVVPRSFYRARNPLRVWPQVVEVIRERWSMAHVKFALVGLGAWYVTYASFRNLKSFVPFVNRHLWDGVLEDVDRVLWLGNEPADVLHDLLGTGVAAHVLSFIYIAWIVMVPASLVVALVWSRAHRAGEWYVTSIALAWVLGVATYFAVPSLGPVYANPEAFADLARTDVTGLQETMMTERHEVLVNPFVTDAVQTIAAFASLHVGISVAMALMAELLRLRLSLRIFLWVFLALTVVSTVYLGWHYFVDAIGGVAIGVGAVWIAAWGTGNSMRRHLGTEAGQAPVDVTARRMRSA
jgi:membrane-associated phospholipid phosphatase